MSVLLPIPFSGGSEARHAWSELTEIVHHVRELTKSAASAMALVSHNPAQIECRARSGTAAPEIGTGVLLDESLTALCIRSGRQVFSYDITTDPRVPSAAIFDPSFRSVVITPICQRGRVRGVLAVYANMPHGYCADDLAALNAAAERIAGLLWSLALTPDIRHVDTDAGSESEQTSRPELLPSPEQQPRALEGSAEQQGGLATLDALAQRKTWPPNRSLLVLAALCIAAIAVAIVMGVTSPADSQNIQNRSTLGLNGHAESSNTIVSSPITSQSGSVAFFRIETSPRIPREGSIFAAYVRLLHGQDIASLPMQINYDPRILHFVSLSTGEFFSRPGYQALISYRDDPSSGTLKINVQLPPGVAGNSGDGTICRLAFVAAKTGSSTVTVVAGARDSENRSVNVTGSRVAVTIN